MNIKDIIEFLPHRFPYLLVDKVEELRAREFIVGIKNVTINEPFFQGHYPDNPIMPNGLILESLVQTASLLMVQDSEFAGRYPTFKSIQSANFIQEVKPGDQLRLEVQLENVEENTMRFKGHGLVEGKIVCEAMLTFGLIAKPSRPQIHPTASVHPSAELGKDVIVGAYTMIGENVRIGDRTILESNIMIEKWTTIGESCHIHFGSVIGSEPQDTKYKGEKSWVAIGDRNQIREYVTINRATGKGNTTQIGDDNLLLTGVHIGHNCRLGNSITITNTGNIAGHADIEDKVIIGGMAGVHQFVRIGEGAMIGAYTRLIQDIAPFMLCEGNPAIVRGINSIGLKRRGVTMATLKEVKTIYKLLYRSELNSSQAMAELKNLNIASEEGLHIQSFIQSESARGLNKKSAKH